MSENKKLSKKYKKIDAPEESSPASVAASDNNEEKKLKKEKKAKAEKPPREKKQKEPKPPKEKKIKEPKPPKEKKIKEPKPPKEKKQKEPKPPRESLFKRKKSANGAADIPTSDIGTEQGVPKPLSAINGAPDMPALSDTAEPVREAPDAQTAEASHRTEEIILPAVKSVKKKKSSKPPKEKKPKKEKAAKEPRQKKEKKPKEPKEKKPRQPFKAKDYLTIVAAVLALALVGGMLGFRYYINAEKPSETEKQESKLVQDIETVQLARNGIYVSLVQSDIPDLFYGFTTDYAVEFYRYTDGEMTPLPPYDIMELSVPMGGQSIPVTVTYVMVDGRAFGMGVFRSDSATNEYFYNLLVFKLTELPAAFKAEGKALLLASTDSRALTDNDILWSDSFTLDLNTGKAERFLKDTNRTIDANGAGDADFCILTREGYSSSASFIPFITSREYDEEGKQDIYIKSGADESLYIGNVYGKYLLTDNTSVIFMRKTATGFDLMKKTDETEEKLRSFYGTMSSNYMVADGYLLDITEGKVYNLRTNEEKTLIGYRMTPEAMTVSPDGKFLVMMGSVQSAADYQLHIFNLQTGDYMRYSDTNYSSHANLSFINNSIAVCTVLSPTKGYEYIVLDMNKAAP